MNYEYARIEEKWQHIWEEKKIYGSKQTLYCR